MFSRKLYRARHRDSAAYHGLAREYADEFRRKWLAEHPQHRVLGTTDIQSLNDLGQSLETAEATRLYPFGGRTVVRLWAGVFLPMVPLLLLTTPIVDIVTHFFGKMLFGLSP